MEVTNCIGLSPVTLINIKMYDICRSWIFHPQRGCPIELPIQIIMSPIHLINFWFNNGNIVLHVELCLFHVHHRILLIHSEIFRKMFSFPQPTAADGDVVKGCFVIHLHNRAVDWTHVLEAFYSGRYMCFHLFIT